MKIEIEIFKTSKQLPKHGQEILFYAHNAWNFGSFSKESDTPFASYLFLDDEPLPKQEVDYWMPLPKLPVDETDCMKTESGIFKTIKKLPKDGQEILYHAHDGSWNFGDFTKESDTPFTSYLFLDDEPLPKEEVDYWMPLPKLPQERND